MADLSVPVNAGIPFAGSGAKRRSKRYAGWYEVHHAHRTDTPVEVTFGDGRTFEGPVTMISNDSFQIMANGIRTTLSWSDVRGVEVVDKDVIAVRAASRDSQAPKETR